MAAVAAIGFRHSAKSAETAPPRDKSSYTLFNPTPDDQLRAFAPDRPSRVTGPITVDAGHFQIESDFLNTSFANQQGASTRSFQGADPVLKLGITNAIDIEVAFGGFVDTRTTDNLTGVTLEKGRGFDDVTLSSKVNLFGNDGGKYAFALEPYLRIPSGTRNVSDGQVEGGILAPFSLSLPEDFNLTLQTELDALRNANGPGTHVNITDIVSVSHAVPGVDELTATAEVYTSLSTERHTPDVYTFDAALAYLVDPNTQFDVGVNLGLSAGAPGYQAYSGIAHRF